MRARHKRLLRWLQVLLASVCLAWTGPAARAQPITDPVESIAPRRARVVARSQAQAPEARVAVGHFSPGMEAGDCPILWTEARTPGPPFPIFLRHRALLR